ncbi:hypothetical protein V8G54_030487 [Vigna mungo]
MRLKPPSGINELCYLCIESQDNKSSPKFIVFTVIIAVIVIQNNTTVMAGNRQKKSSSTFFSIFNVFSSKKPRGRYYDAPDSSRRVWPSDYDKGNWGVAEPNIDMKAEAFIAKYKKRVSESALYQLDPAADNA